MTRIMLDKIRENLPEWTVADSKTILPTEAVEEWKSRAEVRMMAPSDIPRTGIAGLIRLSYSESTAAINNVPQVISMTKQRTIEALPDFLIPGEFSEEESIYNSQKVTKITLPLTIMEDAPHTHVTGAFIVQRDAEIYVAFGALLENAQAIANLVIERVI